MSNIEYEAWECPKCKLRYMSIPNATSVSHGCPKARGGKGTNFKKVKK